MSQRETDTMAAFMFCYLIISAFFFVLLRLIPIQMHYLSWKSCDWFWKTCFYGRFKHSSSRKGICIFKWICREKLDKKPTVFPHKLSFAAFRFPIFQTQNFQRNKWIFFSQTMLLMFSLQVEKAYEGVRYLWESLLLHLMTQWPYVEKPNQRMQFWPRQADFRHQLAFKKVKSTSLLFGQEKNYSLWGSHKPSFSS